VEAYNMKVNLQPNLKEKDLANWVREFTGDLLSWASYKVSNSELAKDLVQDTFLAASEKIESFRGDSSPKTWLLSILNYKIIDYYRSKTKQSLSSDNLSLSSFFSGDGEWLLEKRPAAWNDDDMNLLDNEDFNLILRNCISSLPEQWSIGIKLKYLMGKKGEEICQELGITPTNFWQIMHRAKLQLRECIENNWTKDN
jgi:RNA polymerase sigma-70 factor (ECF subfamily)